MTLSFDLGEGLVGHWTMDDIDTDNGLLRDRTAQPNHGSLENGVTSGSSGLIGQSYSFDADEDAVDIPVNNALEITDTITISVWLNLNSSTDVNGNTSHHIYKGDYGIIHGNYFVEEPGAGRVGAGTTPPTDNAWHHSVMRYDGSNVEGWIDASLDASTSYTGSIDTGSSPLRVGNAGGYDWTTDGKISNLRVYNRAITDEEIDALYNMRNQRSAYF